jgi:hypothetical protein
VLSDVRNVKRMLNGHRIPRFWCLPMRFNAAPIIVCILGVALPDVPSAFAQDVLGARPAGEHFVQHR